MSIKELEKFNNYKCACGKVHSFTSRVISGDGVVSTLPELCDDFNAQSVYLICDKNTFEAAGERVEAMLKASGKSVKMYKYNTDKLLPDEEAVGRAIMYFDRSCDIVIAVGSGVINDIGKIVANVSNKPYFIVATAPSMDGYAFASSSMEREGIKTTVKSKAPDVIIGDFEILSQAPEKMMLSGLGDMIAKYVAICEWRIASLIVGEYYCEEIAELVRGALKKCIDNASLLLKRDHEAVGSVFEGLVISGAAMEYAGLSRPASGEEHYISHIIDMRSVQFGSPAESHGIQCAIGSLYAIKLYEKLKSIVPDKQRALEFVKNYDYLSHAEFLKSFLGQAGETLVELEVKEGKYDKNKHAERLEIILKNWDKILKIMDEELPAYDVILKQWMELGGKTTLDEIGIENSLFPEIFESTKDIRDKYVLSFLAWDLGITEILLQEAL